jgi:Flp pilus assembly protein TadG
MIRTLHRRLRVFRRADDGVVAVEFVMLFPVVFFLFIWAVELGMLMTKSVLL